MILPNEGVTKLGSEIEEQKGYLNSQIALFEESTTAFNKDRQVRE